MRTFFIHYLKILILLFQIVFEFFYLNNSFFSYKLKIMSGGKKEYFRRVLLFKFNRGDSAAEAIRNICNVYVEDAIGESTTMCSFFHNLTLHNF